MKKFILIPLIVLELILFQESAKAERGSDGVLKIIFSQAISILNPYLSSGSKDIIASGIILEPLAYSNPKGELIPVLAETIPTVGNGGVSSDFKSITWKLKKGLKWSDGSDLTAGDIVFTWKYCIAPDAGCQQRSFFYGISSVEAIDPLTVKIIFDIPKGYLYGVFTGAETPIIHKAQFQDCLGAKASGCASANFDPHGTGPFHVKDFKVNDVAVFEINPYYRDPNKPSFSSVILKGGGSAVSVARSVLETGEYDYTWNIQIEPDVLKGMLAKNSVGRVDDTFGTTVERIDLNPYSIAGEKRSTKEAGPHPFLSDPAVRKALSMARDRSLLVEVGYGSSGRPTNDILPAPEAYVSKANDWGLTQDIAGANKLLDSAGWIRSKDGIRAKNGVRLSLLFQTSTSSVRQGTQALVKDMWKKIGVETELRNINPAVFFGGDISNPDTIEKFYADVQMYGNGFSGVDPEVYLEELTCDKIPSPANSWRGENKSRYCSPQYDALIKQYSNTTAVDKRVEIAKKLNDMLVEEGAIIPLVYRGIISAYSNTLQRVEVNGFSADLWNIADWRRDKK